ncbi:MAG: rRNA maturation RNase YbeY [Kiritimatiellae bacterium]|nr:rRNA maturation RNase YbeY [Kiritimatiellia bacterium]
MTRIEIQNRQRKFRTNRRYLRDLAGRLLALAARDGACGPWRELVLVLVDDAVCAKINVAALGHAGATDVITMTYPSVPGESPGDSAELVLNLERAWLLGGNVRDSSQELALYLAHGCDHLCGRDDATPAARRAMRRRELRWLGELDVPALFAPCA